MAAAMALLPDAPSLPSIRAAAFAYQTPRRLTAFTYHLPPRHHPIRGPPIS